jgi:hypothetical protein
MWEFIKSFLVYQRQYLVNIDIIFDIIDYFDSFLPVNGAIGLFLFLRIKSDSAIKLGFFLLGGLTLGASLGVPDFLAFPNVAISIFLSLFYHA